MQRVIITLVILLATPITVGAAEDSQELYNALERDLYAAQNGEQTVDSFLTELVDADVVLLSRHEVTQIRDPADLPALVLPAGDDKSQRLAVFTSPERAHRVAKTYPEYRYGVKTDFIWVLAHTAPGMGVALNPGWTLGMNIPSYGLLRLRERYEDRIEARLK